MGRCAYLCIDALQTCETHEMLVSYCDALGQTSLCYFCQPGKIHTIFISANKYIIRFQLYLIPDINCIMKLKAKLSLTFNLAFSILITHYGRDFCAFKVSRIKSNTNQNLWQPRKLVLTLSSLRKYKKTYEFDWNRYVGVKDITLLFIHFVFINISSI